MARPKSEDKRKAIMDAAVRVIVQRGLSASTAVIAQEAGVASGSLFTYFETKADLLNELYLELKQGMAAAAMKDFPAKAKLRDQVFHVWTNWVGWAVAHTDRRRALAQLNVSDEVTQESRTAGHKAMAELAGLIERSRAKGLMKDAPMGFVVAIMNSLAEATMDYIAQDPGHAEVHSRSGFDALWRVLA